MCGSSHTLVVICVGAALAILLGMKIVGWLQDVEPPDWWNPPR